MEQRRGGVLEEGFGGGVFQADVVFDLRQQGVDGDAGLRHRLDEEAGVGFGELGLGGGLLRGALGPGGGAEGHGGEGEAQNAHAKDHQEHFHAALEGTRDTRGPGLNLQGVSARVPVAPVRLSGRGLTEWQRTPVAGRYDGGRCFR
jgi:hypothetical protein